MNTQPLDLSKFTSLAICSFIETDNRRFYVCKEPHPRGPFVLLEKILVRYRPRYPQLVGLQPGPTPKSFRAYIIISLEDLRHELTDLLRSVEWQWRGSGRDQRLETLVSHPRFGNFLAGYDSGNRSDGQDVDPGIILRPGASSPLDEVFQGFDLGWICCTDLHEIYRAARVPRPGLGHLMREKHSQE